MHYRLAPVRTCSSFKSASVFARVRARSSQKLHVVRRNAEGAFDVCKKSYRPLDAFHYFAVKCGAIHRLGDMGELRRTCFQYGLSPRGWRFLNEHGRAACAPNLLDHLDISIRFQTALAYVEWQARSGLATPLPLELGMQLVALCDDNLPTDFGIDPRLALAAYEHWKKIDSPEQRATFADTEWLEMLLWVRDTSPTLDRNQWQAGWPAITRAHNRWLQLNQDRVDWKPVLEPLLIGDLKVVPLKNSFEVAFEGIRMKHCVAAYIEECTAGDYLLFSLRDPSTEKPVATASLARVEGRWWLDQVRGKCNADTDKHLVSVAEEIQELANRACYKKSLRRLPLGDIVDELDLPNSHKTLLNSSRYLVRQVRNQFSAADAAWLGDHANWLQGLATGVLKPLTPEQERFVSAAQGKHPPHGKHEEVWNQYQRIRSLEEAQGKRAASPHPSGPAWPSIYSTSRKQSSNTRAPHIDSHLDELLRRCEACGVSVNSCRCYDL